MSPQSQSLVWAIHCHLHTPESNSTMVPWASISKIHWWPYFPKSTFAERLSQSAYWFKEKRGKEEEGSERGTKGWGENEGLYGQLWSEWLAIGSSHDRRPWRVCHHYIQPETGFWSLRVMKLLWETPDMFSSKQLAVMDKYVRRTKG